MNSKNEHSPASIDPTELARKKKEIDRQWLPDILGWIEKMDEAQTHVDKMWYQGLYERAEAMYEFELLKAENPDTEFFYPMDYWKKGDKQSLARCCWENWAYENGALDHDGEPTCSVESYPGCPCCNAEGAHLPHNLQDEVDKFHANIRNSAPTK